ncbi:MAG: GPP34 family phosphoprotein [Cyclobacteriaceae bacterium]
MRTLNTIEKYLLLAQHPEKGRWMISDMILPYGIVGAILLGMNLRGLLKIDGKYLLVNDQAGEINQLKQPLDYEVFNLIKNSKKKRKITQWISKVSRKVKTFKWVILYRMEKDGYFSIEHKKFLFIPYKICRLKEKSERNELIQRLREIVLKGQNSSPDEAVLLSLIYSSGGQGILSNDRKEKREIKKALKLFIKENPIAESVDQTIQEVQVAISAAVTAATVSATVTTSS